MKKLIAMCLIEEFEGVDHVRDGDRDEGLGGEVVEARSPRTSFEVVDDFRGAADEEGGSRESFGREDSSSIMPVHAPRHMEIKNDENRTGTFRLQSTNLRDRILTRLDLENAIIVEASRT